MEFRVEYILLLTDTGMNSDWQLRSKNNAVFLPSPMKKKKKINMLYRY